MSLPTDQMNKPRTWQAVLFSETGVLILLALLRLAPLLLTNGQSGWHRDELDMLDNARYLSWAYVSYPPVAPFIARIALTLFGPSMVGVRLFSTLAHAVAMVLTGLMARELGAGAGRRSPRPLRQRSRPMRSWEGLSFTTPPVTICGGC